ncbi:hypothetical protein BABINDRAFT_160418 [Babjeviella inositovora NRRL Y-12698]|uniref:UBA domain-containing protein n=1 Tax=Babjeviella inositovora NRRL Y-12698 TaxID=984486 RepID=A0A1E3QTI1_9ASCO|nr:uncharacterized protein BABINDRAFT_160418 [Babjeviella inositovora NRRL Y-12698]ODQ80995.1 hypothetical protein BABINDRAFT_160418 [Babjeviella inositovora NRRL Y-12698]
MSRKNDAFADLFSTATNHKPKTDKIPLAQRQAMKPVPAASSWADVDLLSPDFASGNSSSSSVPTQKDEIDDLFEIFNKPAPVPVAPVPAVTSSSPQASQNGSFASSLNEGSESSNGNRYGYSSRPHVSRSQGLFSSDDDSDDPSEASAPSHSHLESTQSDEILAELLEMGFTMDQATGALRVTGGSDINIVISYLMDQAHRSPQPRARASETGELNEVITQLSSDFKNVATSWLNKGRKQLVKGMEMYKEQQFQSQGAQPAWMRNQEKYKAGSKQLEGDEEVAIDQREVERIVREQREREKERTRERMSKIGKAGASVAAERQTGSMERQNRGQNGSQHGSQESFRPSLSQSFRSSLSPSLSQRSSYLPASPAPATPAPATPEPQLVDLFGTAPAQRFKKAEDEPMMVSSSRRRRVTPTASLVPSTPSFTSSPAQRPATPLNEIQRFEYTRYKDSGNQAFTAGDFATALEQYELALQQLPPRHDFSIVVYSNLAAAGLKLGDSRRALDFANAGLEVIGAATTGNINGNTTEKPVKELWLKLVGRKAEALEHLEKWPEALAAYTLVIQNGGAGAASMDAKRRCQKMVSPQVKPAPKPVAKPVVKPTTKPLNNSSGALNRVKKQAQAQTDLDAARFASYDAITARITAWKLNKETNLRALLSSLQEILPVSSNWKPVGMGELVLTKKVKVAYMRAVSKTHPDKIGADVAVEDKLVMEGVFVVLNEAWDQFKELNGIS